MLDYTIDVLLIGLIAVLLVEAIKAPIKAIFAKKGLDSNEKLQTVFKIIAYTLTLVICFAGSCVYFKCFLNINPFASTDIVWYFIGTVGSSQAIYLTFETYGRDGIWALIKQLFASSKNTTDLEQLQNVSKEDCAKIITDGIKQIYVDAPVTEEEIKEILDHIQ